MLKLFRALASDASFRDAGPRAGMEVLAPDSVYIDGRPLFPLRANMARANGLPYVDWKAVEAWVAGLPVELRSEGWSGCVKAWLLHLGEALGPQYRLEQDQALLLSTLEQPLARATLEFINRTSRRIASLLRGIAAATKTAPNILVAVDDEETYYTYVSHYYPAKGEFAFSGGIFIDSGCAHFATVKADLQSIEPTIVHEMTHASVAHLRLPLWLNEGLAVNTESALTRPPRALCTPEQMRRKHLAFWGSAEIQEFWSGESFARTDDGNMLSYDLARIMVEHMAKDWPRFSLFALAADRNDAGSAAARTQLGVDLGDYVCALLEKKQSEGWAPDPGKWNKEIDPAGRIDRQRAYGMPAWKPRS